MATKFEKGMDDYYLGKEITGNDPGLEYLQGYRYAESLYEEDPKEQYEEDPRVQQDDRDPQQPLQNDTN